MLNIGQVVYDYTNNRVIIFAGLEMFQNQKGECQSESGFILKDGTFVHSKGEEAPFKYTNLNINGEPFIGSFVPSCGCDKRYFGIIDGHAAEVKDWAKKAIEETECLIAKHGLNTTKEMDICDKKMRTHYHIGQPVEHSRK